MQLLTDGSKQRRFELFPGAQWLPRITRSSRSCLMAVCSLRGSFSWSTNARTGLRPQLCGSPQPLHGFDGRTPGSSWEPNISRATIPLSTLDHGRRISECPKCLGDHCSIHAPGTHSDCRRRLLLVAGIIGETRRRLELPESHSAMSWSHEDNCHSRPRS